MIKYRNEFRAALSVTSSRIRTLDLTFRLQSDAWVRDEVAGSIVRLLRSGQPLHPAALFALVLNEEERNGAVLEVYNDINMTLDEFDVEEYVEDGFPTNTYSD